MAWPGSDHHQPCPCGAELDDECARCNAANPLGSMRIVPPIGSSRPTDDLPYSTEEACS